MNSIKDLKDAKDVNQFGGKAVNLAILLSNNFPVPDGVAIGVDAFDSEGKLVENSKTEILNKISRERLYAVRSSATTEDAEDASWAGQFESFLNIKSDDVIEKVEQCHNSAKLRVKAYAEDKETQTFNIAVVVQEMLKPEYAGVLFTRDPMTGENKFVTEYVEGLGEKLVSGQADPKHSVLDGTNTADMPFDNNELINLARDIEKTFSIPQDIEWVWENNKTWLVQTRPITATQNSRSGFYLGEPNDLFYWGPSRATAMYMSDFMTAVKSFLTDLSNNPDLPNPPKTLVLFNEGKMVWLNNANDFSKFTEDVFKSYISQNRFESDLSRWKEITDQLKSFNGDDLSKMLVEAWYTTEFAEFALYGSETSLINILNRFDANIRQEIWATFTSPDNLTFLSRIDSELVQSQNPNEMAKKYYWIQNGYDGLKDDSKEYFEDRLRIIGNEMISPTDNSQNRIRLQQKYNISDDEINALTLARKLAEFMDERKAWMMQTRELITNIIGDIEYGWIFNNGESKNIDQDDVIGLWERYVDFKTSTKAVMGIVASNGGKHFINGEVVVVNSPTDSIENNRIVVVPSTSPSYVPMMRKAKALIADHGGMMSHAAIVAREFNLPCIVGTKQATKILKTGDKVVLDLVKGEINK